jgi:hypothetical protein
VGLTTPPHKNKLLRDLKKQQPDGPVQDSIKWGRMEEAFEEGQGPHRVAEPVTMILIYY